VKRGEGKFCTQSCATSYFNARRKKRRVRKNCRVCGRFYSVKPCRAKTSKFCSRPCLDKAKITRGEYAAVRRAFKTLPRKCNRCPRRTNLVLHHRDEDHFNNRPSNWEILCRPCHGRHHRRTR
jgi:hypothetical protein